MHRFITTYTLCCPDFHAGLNGGNIGSDTENPSPFPGGRKKRAWQHAHKQGRCRAGCRSTGRERSSRCRIIDATPTFATKKSGNGLFLLEKKAYICRLKYRKRHRIASFTIRTRNRRHLVAYDFARAQLSCALVGVALFDDCAWSRTIWLHQFCHCGQSISHDNC